MGAVLSGLQTELLATFKGVEARSEKANLQETGESSLYDTLILKYLFFQTVKLYRSILVFFNVSPIFQTLWV